MKTKQIRTIEQDTKENFDNELNRMISQGWKPWKETFRTASYMVSSGEVFVMKYSIIMEKEDVGD